MTGRQGYRHRLRRPSVSEELRVERVYRHLTPADADQLAEVLLRLLTVVPQPRPLAEACKATQANE